MTRFAEWSTEVDIGSNAPHFQKILTADRVKITTVVSIDAGISPDYFITPGRLAGLFFRSGRAEVAELIEIKIPTSPRIKLGDLSEVLCTTFVHECTPFKQGIKRLRWKDPRNMSMRDEDLLVFNPNQATGHLTVLKAELKIGTNMRSTTVNEACKALPSFDKVPSLHAVNFVADRLTEPNEITLKNAIDDEQLRHMLKLADVTLLAPTLNCFRVPISTNPLDWTGEPHGTLISVSLP